MKLDLSTPWEDIRQTYNAEKGKAEYWYNKKVGGEKGLEKIKSGISSAIRKDAEHRPRYSDAVEWTSQDGNKWLLFQTAYLFSTQSKVAGCMFQQYELLWYETVTSAGLFIPMWTDRVSVMTPHFFYRYNERLELGIENGKDLLLVFSCRNSYLAGLCSDDQGVIFEKDGQKFFYIALQDGLGIGAIMEDGHRWEVRTFIPRSWMSKEQVQMTRHLFDRIEEHKLQDTVDADGGMSEEQFSEFLAQNAKEYIEQKCPRAKNDDKVFTCILSCCKILVALIMMKGVQLPSSSRSFDAAIDMASMYGYDITDSKVFSNKVKTDIVTMLRERYNLPITVGDYKEAFEAMVTDILGGRKVTEINERTITKEQETMNSLVVAALKKCLKKNGAKNFGILAKEFCKSDVDGYIVQAEVEYVISRVAAVAKSDRDRERYREANKAWLSMVIDNDWSNMLKPFAARYGKELLKMSVCDMIDHDQWWSPAVNTNLIGKSTDYFEQRDNALQGIHDDIAEKIFNDESLKELLPENRPSEQQPTIDRETSQPDGSSAHGLDGRVLSVPAIVNMGQLPVEGMFCPPEVAMKSAEHMVIYMKQIEHCVGNISRFVSERCGESALQKDFENQTKENERLQKALEEQKQKSSKLEGQRGEVQALANMRFDEIQKLKKDKERLSQEKDDVARRLSAMETDYEALKASAQEALPRKKVITLSRLVKFANMGTLEKPSKSCLLLMEQIFPLVDVTVDMKH